MSQGLILFAHGARDARWAEPFERLRERVSSAIPKTPVALAYLEFMAPDLPKAAAALCASGCRQIVLVPIFLGQGGHLRQDLPRLLQEAATAHPDCQFRMSDAAGEDGAVIDALATYCLRQLSDRA
ncbi:MAG TPA: CbiX/SirB N-terminal domain-containing protein [Casimicrobiaceae bacterium]|nr:CbiX/SirB N-terminal domain-containing protein [Casimicrobiaceae bacterium]